MEHLKKLRKALTKQELKVIEQYIAGSSWVSAYHSVFPDEKNQAVIYGLKKAGKTVEYLNAMEEEAIKQTLWDKQKILEKLQKAAELALDGADTTTTTYKDGEEVSKTVTHKKELSAGNKSLELLGKNLGMFGSEITINGLDEVVKELKDKGDSLAAMVDTDE